MYNFQLSAKALQIAEERPLLWEYRLCAQIVIDEVESGQIAFQQGQLRSSGLSEIILVNSYAKWLAEKMNDLRSILDGLSSFINSNHDTAFGLPGEPGNIVEIVSLSRYIGSYYLRALRWVQNVRDTSVEPRLVEKQREMALQANGIIIGIEEFGPKFLKQIEEVLSEPDSATPKWITVALNVAPRNSDQVPIAFELPTKAKDLENEITHLHILTEVPQAQSSKAGYLYLLVNPSMDGLVKIGKTNRNPRERAKELGAATGVPTSFILVFDIFVDDCDQAEKYVHTQFEKNRVSTNKEFFRVLTNEAVKAMLDAQKFVAGR